MRCGKAQKWLSLEMDDHLPPDKTPALEEHLQRCTNCRSYRDDLLLGRRLLRSESPQLSDNFDWRLQLRLNHSLKDIVGNTALPWEDSLPHRGRWWASVGMAAAGGLAVTLAASFLGLFALPAVDLAPIGEPSSTVAEGPPPTASVSQPASDRASLSRPWSPTRGNTEVILTGGETPSSLSRRQVAPRGWNGREWRDLQTITALRGENSVLYSELLRARRELAILKAYLDSTFARSVDDNRRKE
jgi:hypothetical protein